MPQGTSTTATRTRRRTRARSDAGSVVGQITQLVSANETLKQENAELTAENQRLRGEMLEIGSALARLTGGTAAPWSRGRSAARAG